MTRTARTRPALATTMALMLIALVAVAVATLAAGLATSARQAREDRDAAQLRQLLLAGVEHARTPRPEGGHAVELPATLTSAGAKLSIEVKGNESLVAATVGGRTAEQVITRDASGKITSVRLVR